MKKAIIANDGFVSHSSYFGEPMRGRAARCPLTNYKRHDSLDNEDPGPSAETGLLVQLDDAAREQATKGAGGRGGREENGHAETALIALIPERDATRPAASLERDRKRG